jgi:hypothetical protein
VFVDYENLALGTRQTKQGEFKMDLVLKRLLEKGRIVYKRAYGDWTDYRSAVRELHAQGISMIDIPRGRVSGKNSADIHMVVDALDLCYAKQHIDVFALLSGLVGSCDEFIYYDDLFRVAQKKKKAPARPRKRGTIAPNKKKQEALDRIGEVVSSLTRDYDTIWGSMVKQTIRRVYPGFYEDYYGYASFNALLEDARDQGVLDLEYDEQRGNYVVRPGRP